MSDILMSLRNVKRIPKSWSLSLGIQMHHEEQI